MGDAKICLLNCASPEDKWFMRRGDLISGQDFDDLEQIVDAWELVESHGGLAMVKRQYSCFANACESVRVNQSPRVLALGIAINLVEQCYES